MKRRSDEIQEQTGVKKTTPSIPGFPADLDICNVTKLSFNEPRMPEDISQAYIPLNGTKYAYAPWITKCGSSSMTKAIEHISNDAPVASDLSTIDFDQYQFLSVVRHPMHHALAGYHQVEVFWIMNWITKLIDEKHLTWWNTTCLNSTWGSDKKADRPCKGTKPLTTITTRLERLNAFLDELLEKGFWDQHIAPITYIISVSQFKERAVYFDIQSITNLTAAMKRGVDKDPAKPFVYMERGDGIAAGMDWQVRWNELVEWSSKYDLATRAIEKLCHLYRNDVDCLPYNVPECSYRYNPSLHR